MSTIANLESKASSTLTHLRRRTVLSILKTWRDLKGTARSVIGSDDLHPSLPKEDLPTLRRQMQECLTSHGGEITARAHTVELGKTYLSLTDTGRGKFLRILAEDFDIDRAKLVNDMEALKAANGRADAIKLENELRETLTTPRSIILRQFNALPDGFKFLVDMRTDLLPLIGKNASLKGLEYDLKNILSSWFDIGLLDLVEITWDSPAAILEKLIAYEAVHKIKSWDDLKNRLDSDRRVYGFFHNKMPHEPLIFVYVALTEGIAGNVQAILDETTPVMDTREADTAIFYSISNAQRGLAGISFGNFLIKRVVDKLHTEMKQVKHFATLSPVPGFRAWLDPLLARGDESLLLPKEVKEFATVANTQNGAKALHQLLESDWAKDAKLADKMRAPLLRLCAKYLVQEKRKQLALDPVAHFHLSNGARLERIDWLGDTSPKGLKQSAGIMVNYYYDPGDIDDNHENYVTEGKVATSRSVRGYL